MLRGSVRFLSLSFFSFFFRQVQAGRKRKEERERVTSEEVLKIEQKATKRTKNNRGVLAMGSQPVFSKQVKASRQTGVFFVFHLRFLCFLPFKMSF
jgi:hypothetical protein